MRTTRILAALTLASAIGQVHAVQINFTGGTVTRNDSSTETTNNSVNWDDVSYYTEGGFKLEFFGTTTPFTSNIGNYYGVGNDVIHGHWATGSYGGMTQIKVTKLDNSAFDLNYFVLTSNTDFGGGPASGSEKAYIHASLDGTTSSFSQLLPSEDWGFPATSVFLGSNFDGIKAFWFSVDNKVDCFGMDNFYIDEAAPAVPEPETYALMAAGLGLIGLMARRRKA